MKAVAAVLLVLCYLAVSHAWTCRDAPRVPRTIRQVDAGQGKVVISDTSYYPYFLSGSSWYRLGTYRLKHVSVGPAGLWGADTSNRVYKYVAGNFVRANGLSMQQVDAGGVGQVVGVSNAYRASCLRSTYASRFMGVGSVSWSTIRSSMRYYSCGPLYGCWGVDTRYRVYNTQRIIPTSCGTANWRYVSGISARVIEVGTDGSVFAVATNGSVYQRTGISSGRTYGSKWVKIDVCGTINHLSYDLGVLWVVSRSGAVMRCTR